MVRGIFDKMPPEIKHVFTESHELGADALTFLTSEHRPWLGGRYVSLIWDMQELVMNEEEIVEKEKLFFRMDKEASPPVSGTSAADMDRERDVTQNELVDEVSGLLPTRWWFASTAFPLLAGTLGPMANAFSICSLSQDWRAEIGTVATGQLPTTVKDPSWAIAINSVSLGFALISNLSLLLNMARRVRFSVSQPITIGGWYIASALLIGLTIAMPRVTDMHNRQMTQAYYYAIMAAAVYFFVSTLLLVTVYGARTGRYSKQFNLTTSQRSMMLQTILYMMYLLIGAAIFSNIENWSYLDAVYWADFTLLTNGIGDLAPATHLGRSLLFPFGVGGILTLALVVMSIRSLMVERARTYLTARTTEKTRTAVAGQLQSGELKKRILRPLASRHHTLSEKQLQREEFHLMREIHKNCAWQLRWLSLLISACAWAILWLVGAVAFWMAEQDAGWTYFTSIYFAYTNLLTIGYGDVTLGQSWGKPFFVLWSLLAVPTTTILISSMGDTVAKIFHDATIFAGDLTLFPHEAGVKNRLLTFLRGMATSIRRRHREIPSNGEAPVNDHPHAYHSASLMEKLASHDPELEDIHVPSQRWCAIVHELGKIYNDLSCDPPKHYTHDEWCFYLGLVGCAEGCSPFTQAHPDNIEVSKLERARLLSEKPPAIITGEKWSWVGVKSPLIGDRNETKWLFEALLFTLEEEVKSQCNAYQKKTR
ncbi:potassium channel [Arthroderma uncinatum]|uniref:potassium channel n=1 Tax=Arthroderma uncinatum TaxID=74035 RepID=UPI00144AA75E|nr:potassium channel [Arthroderma uncinatum]KAF3480013.1 potassium channel [Arthroderma uncinatum]